MYWPTSDYTKRLLNEILGKVNTIMADLTQLQAAAQQISTDVAAAVAALNDLAAKLADGGTVSQADIDAVTAQLTSASSDLDAAVAADDPTP